MSEKETFYNTKTGEYAVAFLTVNASKQEVWALSTLDGFIETDGAYELADNNEWIQVTKDNADLFIDAVARQQDDLNRELQRLDNIHNILEGILG